MEWTEHLVNSGAKLETSFSPLSTGTKGGLIFFSTKSFQLIIPNHGCYFNVFMFFILISGSFSSSFERRSLTFLLHCLFMFGSVNLILLNRSALFLV